jgi:hypothetical protein
MRDTSPRVWWPQWVHACTKCAAEHPVPELYAGGAAKALSVAESIAPRVTEYALRKIGFGIQKTRQPRDNAPDTLFHSLGGHDRIRGEFGNRAGRRSLYNWLEMHPAMRLAMTGGLLGVAATIAARKR